MSMFVAHTAPSAGPGDLLQVSEYLTFPLFAVLVGVGAELSARRHSAVDHFAGSLVRGLALVALGWILVEFGAQVVIVLAPLGVLTLVCWGVSQLPSFAVAVVGLGAWAAAPWSVRVGQERRTEMYLSGDVDGLRWLDLLVSTSYPQLVLVACACAGIVVLRVLRPRSAQVPHWLGGAVSAGALLVLSAVTLVLTRMDVLGVRAYDTTHVTVAFVAALAIAFLAAGLTVAQVSGPLLTQVLAPVAWAGAMTLTLYAAHVAWLAWWVRVFRPGQGDDTWVNVVGMSVAAFVIAALWRLLPLRGGWGRGPLEGLVGTLVEVVARPLRRATTRT